MQDRHRLGNHDRQFWRGKVWLSLGLVAIASHPLGLTLGLGAGAIATVAVVTPAQAAALTQWRFDPVSQQLEVTIPPGTTPRYFLLAQPTRIVMDLPNIDMGAVSEQETYQGAVRQIRVSQFQPGLTRIVLELSPDAVLAPGQVQLQQLTATSNASARWALRPLFESGSGEIAAHSATPAAPDQAASATATASPAPVSPSPASADLPDDLQGRSPSSLLTTAPASVGSAPAPASSGFPPPDSGGVAVPAESTAAPAATEFPAPVDSTPPTPAPSPSRVASDWQIPPALPPALPQTSSPSVVTVPPLSSAAAPQPAPTQPTAPASIQPPTIATAPRNPNLLLPSGTALNLRYPRQTALTLNPETPWQEVLVLDQPVLDVAGNVVFPAESQVIGRFETSSRGSQFIAQAISLNGRNLRLDAESTNLGGDRQVSGRNLIRNSALGAIGVTVLGVLTGGIGLLGLAAGAATGAATTYVTAPQPATIQPNQIVEVRLTRDILR